MAEHFPDSPAPYRPLKYAEAWQTIAEAPGCIDYQQTLMELAHSTQQACEELVEPPFWAASTDEITYRWHLASEEVIQVALGKEVIDTEDDINLLKQALDIIRDNTLDVEDGTGWHEEGLAFPVIKAATEEEETIDLRNVALSSVQEGRLVSSGRAIYKRWEKAGKPGALTLVVRGIGVVILAGGLATTIADEVFDLHLADKAANVDIMPDSPWPVRIGQATVQCIGVFGGSDRDIDCQVFDVMFGDGTK
jgi:hypothetical protein